MKKDTAKNFSQIKSKNKIDPLSFFELFCCLDRMTTRKVPQEIQKVSWRFTVNNIEADDDMFQNLELLVENGHCKFVCASHEIAPTTGMPHMQGYLFLAKRLRRGQVVKLLEEIGAEGKGPHVDECDKGHDVNINYVSGECEKKGFQLNPTFVEFGTRPGGTKAAGERERKRYQRAYELAREGKLDEVDPDIFIRHPGGIRAVYNLVQHRVTDLEECCGIWLWGAPGCGKSYHARELAGPDAYIKNCNKWFDGYRTGGDSIQQNVIIDDFGLEHSMLGYHLKIWADRYAFSAEVKGTSIMARPKMVIVTSNYHPSTIFSDSELIKAILRRYKTYECKYCPRDKCRTRIYEEGTGFLRSGDDEETGSGSGTVRTFVPPTPPPSQAATQVESRVPDEVPITAAPRLVRSSTISVVTPPPIQRTAPPRMEADPAGEEEEEEETVVAGREPDEDSADFPEEWHAEGISPLPKNSSAENMLEYVLKELAYVEREMMYHIRKGDLVKAEETERRMDRLCQRKDQLSKEILGIE